MQTALVIWNALKGYKTYAASLAAVLTELANFLGLIPSDRAHALAASLAAAGIFFLRLSNTDLAKLLQDAIDGKTTDSTSPDVLKFPTDTAGPRVPLMIVFALLLGTGVAAAAPPKAIIEGTDPSISGEIVVLDGSGSDGMPTAWTWEITPEIKGRRNLLPLDQGKRVVVHSFPGDYLIELIVSNADGHSRAIRSLHIPGVMPPSPGPQPVPPQPIPPVPPGPVPVPPQPTPPPEPALTGLALSTYTAAMAVTSPNRAEEALCLANGCQALCSAIAAGKYSGTSLAIAQGIVAEMGAVMDRCSTAPWKDCRELLATKVESAWKAGSLKSIDDWKSALGQIEQGLRRVK